MSIKVRPETVPYPYFMLFVIYNKRVGAWHKGGTKKFIPSKYVTGAKMYRLVLMQKKWRMIFAKKDKI